MRTRLLTVNPSSECYQNNGTRKQKGSAFSRLFFFALTHCDLSAQSPRPRTRGTLETTRFQKSLRAARLLLFAQISAGKPQICDFSFCLRVHRKSLKKFEDKLSRQIIPILCQALMHKTGLNLHPFAVSIGTTLLAHSSGPLESFCSLNFRSKFPSRHLMITRYSSSSTLTDRMIGPYSSSRPKKFKCS